MILDARSVQSPLLECDLCIVGAGAAGISLALAFAGTAVAVVLLEGGGLEFEEASQAFYEGENRSAVHFPIETQRLRYLGGTTNHWGGTTLRLQAHDPAARPDVPGSGWPITLADLEAHFPAAEALCQLGTDRGSPDDWQRACGQTPLRLERGALTTGIIRWSPPTRFGEVYRDRLAAASNIRVLLHANATGLMAAPDASRVNRVEVACLDGPRFRVRARRFVLAQGALETPRLLLLSNQQQAAGLGNGHGMVGRCYMDHPGVTGSALQLAPGAPAFDFFYDQVVVGDARVTGVFAPRPETLVAEGIGNFKLSLGKLGPMPQGIEAARTLMESAAARVAPPDLGRNLAHVLMDLDQVSNVIYKSLIDRRGFLPNRTAGPPDGRLAGIHVSAEQLPNPDSRVTLSDRTDALGQRKLVLDWRLQERDYRTLRRGVALFASAIAANGLGRVRSFRELGAPAFPRLIQTACHAAGTARMADDPKQGVVDRNLRVHGISNLFVAGGAVFPSVGAANPTLTIVALALRLAEHLKQDAA